MGAQPVTGDPFPRERVTRLLRRLPRYARLGWSLAREPRLPRARRVALIAGAAYLASPIDLVPGIIPVAGQLDDAAAVLLALRVALAGLPPATRERHLREAGLRAAELDEDLRTVGATAAWMVRGSVRLTTRALRAGARWAGARLRRPTAWRPRPIR
jgi:uncharacterized membrane protein YkvA (DUF1232 family)